MSTVTLDATLDFELPAGLEAREPAEVRGSGRDDVRMLVGRIGEESVEHRAFADLPDLLHPGDVLVVNVSGTLPAAVDATAGLTVHFSTQADDGGWIVELRRDGERYTGGRAGQVVALPGGRSLRLTAAYSPGRLWRASLHVPDVRAYLATYGRPIRYGYVDREWPLSAYQTVFATEAGSAEMPSAGRPFTAQTVVRLAARGVLVVPIALHTGVASPEADEKPYPEWFTVPTATARAVAQARAAGGRVIAVGTTVVRALESAADTYGRLGGTAGWTDLVVTPDRGVRVVDGLVTGLHEPRASHLAMLEAIAGRPLLRHCYDEALRREYLWHEFGDINLLLP